MADLRPSDGRAVLYDTTSGGAAVAEINVCAFTRAVCVIEEVRAYTFDLDEIIAELIHRVE